MLGKLLKYDLKWIYKVILVFYALSFVFAVIARMFESVENSVMFDILAKIAAGCACAMIINGLVNCIIRSWARFRVNIYKDEAYLTHTLPVSKNNIYLAKVLSAIICAFTSVAVMIACLFICYYSKENMQALKSALNIAANTYNTTVLQLLLAISIIVFLEIVYILMVGYTGIIVGHRSNKNKMGKTIIAGFAMYIITMLLSLGIIYIIGLFNEDIMNLFISNQISNMNIIKSVIIIGIALYSVINIIYYFIGKSQLEKGVNVD